MTSRRDTLRTLGSMAALPFLGPLLGVDELIEVGRRAHMVADRGELGALTPAEYEIVTLAAERIIPRTTTPGATDARVADFVDVMLSDWYNDAERRRFLNGVNELAAHGFARMSPRQQTELLETLDREARTNDHWFAMLKFLTVWGYYTSRVGIVDELRVQLTPGRFVGNAPY